MRLFSKLAMIIVAILTFFVVSPLCLVVEAASKVSNGSMVGGVMLEGLTYDEAKQRLSTEVEHWQSEAELIAAYDQGTISIPRDLFQFDIDTSLEQLKKQTKQPWYLFFLKDKSAQLPLVVKVKEESKQSIESPSYIDMEATLQKAETLASYLGEAEVTAVYEEDGVVVEEIVANVEVPIPNTYVALERLVQQLNGQKLSANHSFSFLESVVAPLETSPSGKEMNFVASAFYALILHSNIEIIERHSQGEIPQYLEPGIEVKVSQYEGKDLLIYNPNPYSYTVHAEMSGRKLLLSLHSVALETKYEYSIENKVEIEPRTIYRYSKDLRPRQQKTIDLGEQGMRVEVYRLNVSEKGSLLNKELVSRDFYPPTPKVVLISTKEPPLIIGDPVHQDGENDDLNNEDSDGEYTDNEAIKGYEIIDLEEEDSE